MDLGTIKASLSGKVRVSLYDNHELEQEWDWTDNVITNMGLDYFGQYSTHQSSTTYPVMGAFRNYCAVGTGGANPAETDTALGNEVMRTNSTGGHPNPSTTITVEGDYLVGKFYITRYFNFAQTLNLTEYGFSPTSSSGVSIRQLFRDTNGNPIQISVLPDKQLKIEHELTIKLLRIPAAREISIVEYDAGMNPTGDVVEIDAFETLFGTSQSVFTSTASPIDSCSFEIITQSGASTSPDSSVPTTNPQRSFTVLAGYVPGSYTRRKRLLLTTSETNRVFYGIVAGSGSYGNKLVFSAPFTKDNIHDLEIFYNVVWGRDDG